jgi:hypothetical protein
MGGDDARTLFDQFVSQCRVHMAKGTGSVAEGEFGAMMEVNLTNDGPVTITLESDCAGEAGAQPQKKSKKKGSVDSGGGGSSGGGGGSGGGSETKQGAERNSNSSSAGDGALLPAPYVYSFDDISS